MKRFVNIHTGVILTPVMEEVEKQLEKNPMYRVYKGKQGRNVKAESGVKDEMEE